MRVGGDDPGAAWGAARKGSRVAGAATPPPPPLTPSPLSGVAGPGDPPIAPLFPDSGEGGGGGVSCGLDLNPMGGQVEVAVW